MAFQIPLFQSMLDNARIKINAQDLFVLAMNVVVEISTKVERGETTGTLIGALRTGMSLSHVPLHDIHGRLFGATKSTNTTVA